MSNNILYTTCSVSFGPGSWDHNHRLITLEHVDSTRTKNNKFFNDETLEEGVQIVFGEAKTTFPATNEEPENQECYIDKLKRDGRIKLYMELVVMVGNEKTCGLGTAGWWTSQEILCEFAKRVVGEFKNLYRSSRSSGGVHASSTLEWGIPHQPCGGLRWDCDRRP